MGAMKVMLLFLLLLNFTSSLSFDHVANYSALETFNPASRNNNGVVNQTNESNGLASRGDNGVVNQSKFAHANARGSGGGESSSSRRAGGGAVIPVYAASGANRKPNNHHNAANISNMCRKDMLLFVVATILTSTLLRMCI